MSIKLPTTELTHPKWCSIKRCDAANGGPHRADAHVVVAVVGPVQFWLEQTPGTATGVRFALAHAEAGKATAWLPIGRVDQAADAVDQLVRLAAEVTS